MIQLIATTNQIKADSFFFTTTPIKERAESCIAPTVTNCGKSATFLVYLNVNLLCFSALIKERCANGKIVPILQTMAIYIRRYIKSVSIPFISTMMSRYLDRDMISNPYGKSHRTLNKSYQLNIRREPLMVALAYGAALPDFSESISLNSCFIRFRNFKEDIALEKVTNYHHKCINLAMTNGYIVEPVHTYNDSVLAMLAAGIHTVFLHHINISLVIRTTFIDNNEYMKHQFNAINAGYFFNLFMEL